MATPNITILYFHIGFNLWGLNYINRGHTVTFLTRYDSTLKKSRQVLSDIVTTRCCDYNV